MLHPQMSRSCRLGFMGLIGAIGLLAPGVAVASDHWDSSSARADQAADITDVYAFPLASRPSRDEGTRLVLIMNVHPYATAPTTLNLLDGKVRQPPPEGLVAGLKRLEVKEPGTQFSDAVEYAFRIRPAEVKGSGRDTRVLTDGEREVRISCWFDDAIEQTMTCKVRDGEELRDQLVMQVRVDDESGGGNPYIKAFAGCRADPSFIDGKRVREPHPRNAAKKFTDAPISPVAYSNILSIVLEVDVSKILRRGDRDTLFAVVAQTSRGKTRIDRMGRVFLNSFIVGKMGDVLSAPKLLDLVKDHWNQDDAFHLDPEFIGIYKEALQDGLTFIDGMEISDGNKSVLDWEVPHPLLNLTLNDFLVVDTAYPTTPSDTRHTLLEIELAQFRGRDHRTCGGRKLNDDIVDPWFTLLINGPDRGEPNRGDGVDQATRPASDKFPYLSPPFVGDRVPAAPRP